MEKENVLEIEYQDVFDKVAVRIKKLDYDFFAGVLLKEDVEKYNCSFIESPTDLEEQVIWLYGDIYLSDNNIYCYCEETVNKIKEFVDYINKEYGIPYRWRAKENEEYFTIKDDGHINKYVDIYCTDDDYKYNLGNYFRTYKEAEEVLKSKEWQEFWEKVRNGEIGGINNVEM